MGLENLTIRRNPRKRKTLEINPCNNRIRVIFQEQRLTDMAEHTSTAILNWQKIMEPITGWEMLDEHVDTKSNLRVFQLKARGPLPEGRTIQFSEVTMTVNAQLNDFELGGKIQRVLDKLESLGHCGLSDIKIRKKKGTKVVD